MSYSLKLRHVSLCALLTVLPLGVWAQTTSGQSGSMSNNSSMQSGMNANANMTVADKKFVRDAAQGGLAEVELGKMATEKASNEQVKQFGQRMVDGHSKANDQLKQVAEDQGISLPQTLNAKDKMLKELLSKLDGTEFDRVYMENMVKDHKQDIAEFNKESTSGSDKAVKQFASQTLPTLQSHLQEAEKIEPTVKTASNSGMTK